MTTEQDQAQPENPEQDASTEEAKPKRRTTRRSTKATTASGAKRGKSTKASSDADAPSGTEAVAAPSEGEAAAKKPARKSRATAKKSDAAAPKKRSTSKAASGGRRRPAAKEPAAAEAAAEPVPEAPETAAPRAASLPRLHERLRNELAPQLMKEFSYSSAMQVPRPEKIVVNIGLGEALENSRAIENATGDLAAITGQRPVVRRARKSIASFKLREGQAIGLSVTLRGRRMYEFLDRLVSSSLPRIRDFNGLSRNAFDGRGNYSIGLREQVMFPEIDYNSIDRIRGLQIVIVTTAPNDREGFRLLELLGMPFARTESDVRAA